MMNPSVVWAGQLSLMVYTVPASRVCGKSPRREPEMSDDRRPDLRSQIKVWEYELPGGYAVLAGRTDADNDRLSLKIARPNDWWFHVRGLPGSHVVLQVGKGPEPDKSVLEQAAAIAAWHSKARHGGITAVSYTRASNVRKPRGEKPGTVTIQKERVLKVRPGLPTGTADEGDDAWN
jgi:predicted ribosome quality control (RQC) complex YloA/Tae2 family protein